MRFEPGSTIGILGGGQLGRMIALAAAPLGYRCHIFTDAPDSPASQVSAATTVAAYDDTDALDAFAAAVDVITLEFENIPVATVEHLARTRPVRPGASALSVAQDRLQEKRFLDKAGLSTARWADIDGPDDLEEALTHIGRPAYLKTRRFGYDGKGQTVIGDGTDLAAAWAAIGSAPAIVESDVAFTCEISVIAARRPGGQATAYVPVENRHSDHILRETLAPATLPQSLLDQAREMALTLIDTMEYVGVLGVEMFVAERGRILINEIAPRPHNSGHWTIEGCPTSQFEQTVRAICDLPLGAVDPIRPAVMVNLIGNQVEDWHRHLATPGAHLHLYGKGEARPGRKMGHVTRLKDQAIKPD